LAGFITLATLADHRAEKSVWSEVRRRAGRYTPAYLTGLIDGLAWERAVPADVERIRKQGIPNSIA